MKILVGLGNVGEKYINTRHNIGFMVLDRFCEQLEISPVWKEEPKLKAHTAKIPYNGQILFLVKPSTLMNLSGQAVSKTLNFFKEPPENLIVIYDDIDLPLGTTRFRTKGSAGTHNGMRSIIQDIGTEEFPRLRIGIETRGEEAPAQQDLSSFVLSPFNQAEQEKLDLVLNKAAQELKDLISA